MAEKMFMCDPQKNKFCEHRSCGYLSSGKCYQTNDPAKAMVIDGKPVMIQPWCHVRRENEISECVQKLEDIREIGIVNAREDMKTIGDAVELLKFMRRMLEWMDFEVPHDVAAQVLILKTDGR